MTDIARSNSLAILASRIKAEHEAIGAALKNIVHHAIEAGELLIEAKKQFTKHGEWLPWLADHCLLTERTAQRYMRIAHNRATIEAKSDTGVSDLSLNGALALLTIHREPLDNSLVESVVSALDASDEVAQAVRSQAENARRKVLLDATRQNHKAIDKLLEKLGEPGGPFTEGNIAAAEAMLVDFGLVEPGFIERSSVEYATAVETNNYKYAFAIAKWFFETSTKLRKHAEWSATLTAPVDEATAERYTKDLADALSNYYYAPAARIGS
jgi:Protein of unknown function (DUF3102)